MCSVGFQCIDASAVVFVRGLKMDLLGVCFGLGVV